jgi:hypothetical protein
VQPVSAAHSLDPVNSLSFFFAHSIPSTHSISFQNIQLSLHYEYSYVFLLTSFSTFCDLVDQDILGLFKLSISLLFDFISSLLLLFFLDIISFFSDKKVSGYYFS